MVATVQDRTSHNVRRNTQRYYLDADERAGKEVLE